MQTRKKKMVSIAAILLCAVIGLSVGYALLSTNYIIPSNTVTIQGIGVNVNWWGSGETLGALVTATQFGNDVPPADAIATDPVSGSSCIVLTATSAGYTETITWTTTLPATVGTIALQMEVWSAGSSSWVYEPLAQGFMLAAGQTLGYRATNPTDGTDGHIQLVFVPASGAPVGVHSFSITFTGTSTS